MEHNIRIESRWSDQVADWLKADFARLANQVFGTFVTEAYCKAMLDENIYGPSLLTVAYVGGQPAGVDVMWRNDLFGTMAYQTVNTCVLEAFRGMGLFKRITYHEMEVLGDDTFVYGFPNSNSFPGYVKMGWHVNHLYASLFWKRKQADVDSDYAAWWLRSQSGITCLHRNGACYLVRKRNTGPAAVVLGRVDEATACLFPKTTGLCLLKCFDTKPSIYNKNKTIPLVCNKLDVEIPYWKIDAI